MRIELLVILGIVLIALVLILCLRFVKKWAFRLIVIGVAIAVFAGGGSIINLNTLPLQVEQKVKEVVNTVGDSYIKTQGNSVFIKINSQWYDVAKISIVGKAVTDDITLRYDGEEIYVAQSGVVDVIKTLEKIGLLGSSEK